jgi:hypothetical protein
VQGFALALAAISILTQNTSKWHDYVRCATPFLRFCERDTIRYAIAASDLDSRAPDTNALRDVCLCGFLEESQAASHHQGYIGAHLFWVSLSVRAMAGVVRVCV